MDTVIKFKSGYGENFESTNIIYSKNIIGFEAEDSHYLISPRYIIYTNFMGKLYVDKATFYRMVHIIIKRDSVIDLIEAYEEEKSK